MRAGILPENKGAQPTQSTAGAIRSQFGELSLLAQALDCLELRRGFSQLRLRSREIHFCRAVRNGSLRSFLGFQRSFFIYIVARKAVSDKTVTTRGCTSRIPPDT